MLYPRYPPRSAFTVFTAPTLAETSSSESSRCAIDALWGMVTFRPLTPLSLSLLKASLRPEGGTLMASYFASMHMASKAAFIMLGEGDSPTSSPSSRYRSVVSQPPPRCQEFG